jgi:hypothetical protein
MCTIRSQYDILSLQYTVVNASDRDRTIFTNRVKLSQTKTMTETILRRKSSTSGRGCYTAERGHSTEGRNRNTGDRDQKLQLLSQNAMSNGIEIVCEMTSEDSDWPLVKYQSRSPLPIGMAFTRLKLSPQSPFLRKKAVSCRAQRRKYRYLRKGIAFTADRTNKSVLPGKM